MTVVRYGRGSVIGPDTSHTTWGIVKPQYDELGSRRQVKERGFASKTEAEKALNRWRVECDEGRTIEPSRMTLATLMEQWLSGEVADLRPKTIESYTYSANHITKRIGGTRAQALTAQDVDALKRVLRRETSDRVAHNAMKILRQALAWATRIELVQRNVALLVDLPAYAPEEGIALSHQQARAFLEVAETATYSPLWLLYLSTGVRRGEGLGLTWRDIDWKRNTLTVRQQVTIVKADGGKARPVLAEVKSRASRRTLEIDARLAIALEEHQELVAKLREREQFYRDSNLIFCTRNGLVLSPDNVRKVFRHLCVLSAMPAGLNIHSLRHTHASHLVMAGVPIVEVSRRLGHSKPDITLRLYSHLMPGYVGSATAAVERALYSEAAPATHPALGQGLAN